LGGGCRASAALQRLLDVEVIKPVDGKTWKLELAVPHQQQKPVEIAALLEQKLSIRLVRVEGWDFVGQREGVNRIPA
jgi:hypothetical protein